MALNLQTSASIKFSQFCSNCCQRRTKMRGVDMKIDMQNEGLHYLPDMIKYRMQLEIAPYVYISSGSIKHYASVFFSLLLSSVTSLINMKKRPHKNIAFTIDILDFQIKSSYERCRYRQRSSNKLGSPLQRTFVKSHKSNAREIHLYMFMNVWACCASAHQ